MFRCITLAIGILLLALTGALSTPIPPNYQVSSPSAELQNEEQIFVSPVDSLILIADWRDFRLGYRRIGLGISRDGGNTWTDSLITERWYNRQSDPVMDVDRHGNFYACFLDYEWDGNGSGITFTRSNDDGLTWSEPTIIQDWPPGLYFEDKQFTTIDRTAGPHDGNLYVAWARFVNAGGPNMMVFARSVDGAITFDDVLDLGGRNGQFAQPLVGADGSVHVFWTGGGGIQYVKSVDAGISFTSPTLIFTTWGNFGTVDGGVNVYNGTSGTVDIFGGPYHGNIYLSYANMDLTANPYYDYNIEFVRSTDGGLTWSDPIYVNDDGTGPGSMYDQFHPWLWCNEEGTLITIFYDQRTDVENHYQFDCFAAYSFDGGLSFTTNHRISEVSINPGYLATSVIPSDDGKNYPLGMAAGTEAGLIAEYIGLTAFKDHVNAVWTDTRNGNQDVFGANWTIPLLEPRLISPAADTVGLPATPHFDWATAWKEHDDSYRIEVAIDPDFQHQILSAVVDTTGFTPDALDEGVYYWRVKVFALASSDSSEYSATRKFRVGFSCCLDTRGNANGDEEDNTNVSDITWLVAYLFGVPLGAAPPCMEEGNANGDVAELVNISDISYLVEFLFGVPLGPPPPDCP